MESSNPMPLLSGNMPRGFRFHPTDEETVVYVTEKNNNMEVAHNVIPEVPFYKYSPETLAGDYQENGEKAWWFFTKRERKYQGAINVVNRVAGNGHWKTVGKKVIIRDTNTGATIGYRTFLAYYVGNIKTDWRMNEFTDEELPRFDRWVICKLKMPYKKPINRKLKRKADDNPQQLSEFESSSMDTNGWDKLSWNEFIRLHDKFDIPGSNSCNQEQECSGLRTDEEREFDDDLNNFKDKYGNK